jgi:hypothetical protein
MRAPRQSPYSGAVPVLPSLGPEVVAKRLRAFRSAAEDLVPFVTQRFDSARGVDAGASPWMAVRAIVSAAEACASRRGEYERARTAGRAAAIADVALPREHVFGRLGPFRTYCPVSWAVKRELVDAGESRQFACEFRGRVYVCAGAAEQLQFLREPTRFLAG